MTSIVSTLSVNVLTGNANPSGSVVRPELPNIQVYSVALLCVLKVIGTLLVVVLTVVLLTAKSPKLVGSLALRVPSTSTVKLAPTLIPPNLTSVAVGNTYGSGKSARVM